MVQRTASLWCLVIVLAVRCGTVAGGEDWPSHMHDNGRSGVTSDAVTLPLTEHWVHRSTVEPRPAWPLPQPGWTELPKVDFDDAFYTVADRDHVYFGSSVDNKVYALDATTGGVRWDYYTSGPVRLTPTLGQGRVYVGSDDGRVYCLRRQDGTLVWTFDAAPDPRRVLGNGRVSSLWPVRTGVVLEGDRVFCGGGVFPYHRVFMQSLDASTGQVIWKNDAASAFGGFSPQGHMLTSGRSLLVPSGRAAPVSLSLDSGKLLYEVPHVGDKGAVGGVYGVVVDGVLFLGTQNTLYGIDVASGKSVARWFAAARLAATPDSYFILKGPPAPAYGRRSIAGTGNDITCIDRPSHDKLARKDAEGVKKNTRWRYARRDLASMILAGPHLVAGGNNEVVVLDRDTGKQLWSGQVDGLAVGLTVAHGRLLVSTTKGAIHCFAAGAAPARSTVSPPSPWAEEPAFAMIDPIAKGIMREAGVRRGHALVMGDGAVRLACELAKQSELTITCVEFDAKKLAAARQRVSALGLYGARVTVEGGRPDSLPYPAYAANLVVSLNTPGQPACSVKEVLRALKPCGGVLLTGPLSVPSKESQTPAETVKAWQSAGALSQDITIGSVARWSKLVRGQLKGSGWWTHQYADAGNSGSSGDQLIKGKLDVLWFGEPGADEFTDRHQRGAAPLVLNGRVFCQGWNFLERKNTVFCFDAYNGLRYWKREIEGAVRLGLPAVSGNLACDEESVFVASGTKCHRLDALTGETRAVFETPVAPDGGKRDWAFVAVVDKLLLGSAAVKAAKSPFSDMVFAFDIVSRKQQWLHRPQEVRDTTLVCDGRHLMFVDNRRIAAKANADQKSEKAATQTEGTPPRLDRFGNPIKQEPYLRTVVSLDVASGKLLWEKQVDLTDCGRWEMSSWGSLQALCKDDVLVLAGAYTIYGGSKATEEKPRKAVALSTKDGAVLWSTALDNRSRPVIMHGALLAEPLFFDLTTGTKLLKPKGPTGRMLPWSMGPRTGGCGSLSASDCMVFGRGGYTVWRNVVDGPGAAFVGTRPGCFINIIPAGGVVVQAEASSGCSCYHAVQCTVVFRPRDAE